MGITVASVQIKDKYVSIGMDIKNGRDVYVVQISPCFGDNMCGYPLKSRTYPYTEKEKALKLYNKYVKECSI